MQSNQSSGCESKQEPVEGIEEVEAELEAELERLELQLERLELQLDAEASSKHSYQEMIKIAPKESASASGCSTNFGKLMNPRDEVTEVQSGEEFPLLSSRGGCMNKIARTNQRT